jgi:hypothetical protein
MAVKVRESKPGVGGMNDSMRSRKNGEWGDRAIGKEA